MRSNIRTVTLWCLISGIYIVMEVMSTMVIQDLHFVSDTRFAGVIPTVNSQWNSSNIVHCAATCMRDSDCESFAYDGSTCYGYTSRLLTITPTTSNPQAVYYENKGLMGINLAAGKPSSQNGLYGGHGSQGNYTAEMANDDSRESEPNGNSGSCAHLGYTGNLKTMWWQVDLQAVYHVTHLALLSRKDALPSEFENIKASVGLTSNGNFTDCVSDTGSGFYGQIRTYVCPEPIAGQFVKISKYTSGFTFTLCEVEVYGEP